MPGFIKKNKLAVISNYKTDTASVVVFDTRKKQFEEILYQHPGYDVVDAAVRYQSEGGDPDNIAATNPLVFVRHVEYGELRTRYFSLAGEKLLTRIQKETGFENIDVVDIAGIGGTQDYALLLYGYESGHPGRYIVFYLEDDIFHPIGKTHPNLEDYSLSDQLCVQRKPLNSIGPLSLDQC